MELDWKRLVEAGRHVEMCDDGFKEWVLGVALCWLEDEVHEAYREWFRANANWGWLIHPRRHRTAKRRHQDLARALGLARELLSGCGWVMVE